MFIKDTLEMFSTFHTTELNQRCDNVYSYATSEVLSNVEGEHINAAECN